MVQVLSCQRGWQRGRRPEITGHENLQRCGEVDFGVGDGGVHGVRAD